MVCCNCKGKLWYGDPKGVAGTFFACGCECHKHGGKYPERKQKNYEKRHPEMNPKVKDFPKWFENDKNDKIQQKKDIRSEKGE